MSRLILGLALAAALAVAAAFGLGLVPFGPDDPLARMRDKITGARAPAGRNTQTEALELMLGLCARRGFSDAECGCMRTAMLDAGTRAMAYVGANYGGDFAAASEIALEMDAGARSAAIRAYLDAEQVCLTPSAPALAPGAPVSSGVTVTLADIRASCRPAMAEICACRAEALQSAVGDGALEAALAINRNDRAGLERAASGREDGWAEAIADAYARTSAPCIVQAGAGRRN
jgi:hypothetical protein